MPALLDIALAILVLAVGYLIFGVAAALIKEVKKDNNDNNTPGQ